MLSPNSAASLHAHTVIRSNKNLVFIELPLNTTYCREPVNYKDRDELYDDDGVWYWDSSEYLQPARLSSKDHMIQDPHLVGAQPLPPASIFLYPGLIFIQNFCQFIMVGNPSTNLPTTTCLWFQGLTVFVIDIKLKENTNPRPTDQQVTLSRSV